MRIFLILYFYRHQPLEFSVLDLLGLMPRRNYTCMMHWIGYELTEVVDLATGVFYQTANDTSTNRLTSMHARY